MGRSCRSNREEEEEEEEKEKMAVVYWRGSQKERVH
jgi:hypothetical protein